MGRVDGVLESNFALRFMIAMAASPPFGGEPLIKDLLAIADGLRLGGIVSKSCVFGRYFLGGSRGDGPPLQRWRAARS